MQHTLVAVFDNRTDAQNAMNELMSSNYSRENVRLSTSDTTGTTGTAVARIGSPSESLSRVTWCAEPRSAIAISGRVE